MGGEVLSDCNSVIGPWRGWPDRSKFRSRQVSTTNSSAELRLASGAGPTFHPAEEEQLDHLAACLPARP